MKAIGRVGPGEDAVELLADPFLGDVADVWRKTAHGLPGFGLDGEPEARRETDGPQDAEPVLGEARPGHADGPDDALVQIVEAADEVAHLAGEGMSGQAVDGEVPAQHVLFRGGEGDLRRVAAVRIAALGPERGDLHGQVVLHDQDHAERFLEAGAEEDDQRNDGDAGHQEIGQVVGIAAAAACQESEQHDGLPRGTVSRPASGAWRCHGGLVSVRCPQALTE